MKIAVVDVAAENSGALSVLNDFVDTLMEYENNSENEWYIFTSVVFVTESSNVHNIRCPKIKKSWFHRLVWEHNSLEKYVKSLGIDVIFSLQNNGIPIKEIPQIVYFHNILLVQKDISFSFWRRAERKFFIYNRILAPYIRNSWQYADTIIVQGNSVREMVKEYYSGRVEVQRTNVTLRNGVKCAKKIKGYIYPATPCKYKNVELVIEAMKRIQNMDENFELLITMKGNENTYASELKKLSEGNQNIQWIGYQKRDELLERYTEYGLVMPSLLESFSVPILEAMSYGTVIVAIDKPYAWDAWNETHYNRMYLTEGNIEAWTNALLKGLEDEAEGNYVTSNVNAYEKIIDKILKYR